MQVWKYQLDETDCQAIEMPEGAKIVHVDTDPGDSGILCIWAEVDPDAPKEDRFIYVRGTGHDINHTLVHLGSVRMPPFIWHVYTDPE